MEYTDGGTESQTKNCEYNPCVNHGRLHGQTKAGCGDGADARRRGCREVEGRLIDYVRHHVSHVGGFTAARRIAALADNFEVKFAWHGSPNSPVGHMTNLTLDLTNNNFGIHEHFDYPPIVQDIFHGCAEIKDGYAWISEKPGWGIEVDEAPAAKHPITDERPNIMRTPDGTVINGTG